MTRPDRRGSPAQLPPTPGEEPRRPGAKAGEPFTCARVSLGYVPSQGGVCLPGQPPRSSSRLHQQVLPAGHRCSAAARSPFAPERTLPPGSKSRDPRLEATARIPISTYLSICNSQVNLLSLHPPGLLAFLPTCKELTPFPPSPEEPFRCAQFGGAPAPRSGPNSSFAKLSARTWNTMEGRGFPSPSLFVATGTANREPSSPPCAFQTLQSRGTERPAWRDLLTRCAAVDQCKVCLQRILGVVVSVSDRRIKCIDLACLLAERAFLQVEKG